jgi:hypothetical protein
MSTPTLEERVAMLESEVSQLKYRNPIEVPQDELPWWKKIVGVFKDDPDFEEAVRLGREYRESLRPKDDEDSA